MTSPADISTVDTNFDTDVLIAGAGPVGLTLASELWRYGVRCRIVSKNSGVRETSKALILHVRTQEVFEAMGLIDQAKAEAKPLHQVELSAYGKHIGRWVFGTYCCLRENSPALTRIRSFWRWQTSPLNTHRCRYTTSLSLLLRRKRNQC